MSGEWVIVLERTCTVIAQKGITEESDQESVGGGEEQMKEFLIVLRTVTFVLASTGFFFQRNLPFDYLISVDNTQFFIAYWLFTPMLIWFVVEKIGQENEKDGSPTSHSNIGGFSSATKKKQQRKQALLREREFIREEVAKHKEKNRINPRRQDLIRNVHWVLADPNEKNTHHQGFRSTSHQKPSSQWYFKTKIQRESFEAYMFIEDRQYDELRRNPVSVVADYEKWLKTDEGKRWKQSSKVNSPKPQNSKTEQAKIKTQESQEDKLKKLKDLYNQELISKEVYEKKQLEILGLPY